MRGLDLARASAMVVEQPIFCLTSYLSRTTCSWLARPSLSEPSLAVASLCSLAAVPALSSSSLALAQVAGLSARCSPGLGEELALQETLSSLGSEEVCLEEPRLGHSRLRCRQLTSYCSPAGVMDLRTQGNLT